MPDNRRKPIAKSDKHLAHCSTCGVRKAERYFPRSGLNYGVGPTCKRCIGETRRLLPRAEAKRRVPAGAVVFPRLPLQVKVRHLLESQTQVEAAERLGCNPTLIRNFIREKGALELQFADRWAARLGSHLDLVYEEA